MLGNFLNFVRSAIMKHNYTRVMNLFLVPFLGLFQSAQAQDLNMGVRDVFPRDAWVQGALLVGKPQNFEIARTVFIATTQAGVQEFVVDSTVSIYDGALALIYDPAEPTLRPIDGFDVIVTGPHSLRTTKVNRYTFDPGFILQIVHPVDPNGAILQATGPGGTITRIVENGKEVMRQEVIKDARGRRKVRWREVR